MSAQFAKDQVSFFAPSNLSETGPSVYAPPFENGFAARVRSAAARVAQMFNRRAVISELSMLSDHELADIGLTRSDIPYVFDRNFVATRALPRAVRA
jgi:uncharacterized protein YjiS (DUF1127 family)